MFMPSEGQCYNREQVRKESLYFPAFPPTSCSVRYLRCKSGAGGRQSCTGGSAVCIDAGSFWDGQTAVGRDRSDEVTSSFANRGHRAEYVRRRSGVQSPPAAESPHCGVGRRRDTHAPKQIRMHWLEPHLSCPSCTCLSCSPALLLMGVNTTETQTALNDTLQLLSMGIVPDSIGLSPKLLPSFKDFGDDDKRLDAAYRRQVR